MMTTKLYSLLRNIFKDCCGSVSLQFVVKLISLSLSTKKYRGYFLMLKFLKSNLFFLILLTLVVFVIYGKSLNYEFTKLDDDGLTSKMSLYISDIKNFPKFFLTDCYHNKKLTQYYRPILSLSFAIETIIFGVNTKIYHLTNIVLFIITLYLMYLFLCNLNLNKKILKFVILLFCTHPIFVSTIVWLPARNDTLLAVFLFLFLITYINYINENKFKYFILSSIFFVFALFTKETALIIFPVILLLMYCFNLKITKKQILNYLLIFIPVMILYFYLRQIVVIPVHLSHYINHVYEYVLTIIFGLMFYIKYLFMVADIPIMLYELKFDILSIVINIIVFVVLVCLCYFKVINKKIIVFSVFFFVLFMLPAFAQEFYLWLPHRLIIPLVSIVFILTETIDRLILKYNINKKFFVFLFVILMVSFGFASYLQADKYKNYKSYWINSYHDAPTHANTMNNLADIYIENKEYYKAKELLLKIIENCKEVKYYLKLSSIEYLITKDLDVAENNYLECLKIAEAPYYRADVLAKLGETYYFKNDLNKAIDYTKQALELQPYDKDNLIHLAGYYALNKDFSQARPIFESLLSSEPKNEYYQYLIKTLNDDEKSHKTFL